MSPNTPTLAQVFCLINADLPKFKIIYTCRACPNKFHKILMQSHAAQGYNIPSPVWLPFN